MAQLTEAFGGGGIGLYTGQIVDGQDETGDPPRLHLDVRHAAGGAGPARWSVINGVYRRGEPAVLAAIGVDMEQRSAA
jgi:hypothetical protein